MTLAVEFKRKGGEHWGRSWGEIQSLNWGIECKITIYEDWLWRSNWDFEIIISWWDQRT